MLRITKESEYALLLLSVLSGQPDKPQNATELARQTGIALPMTGKVLKQLVKQNILSSTRGAYGGYALKRVALSVSIFEVIKAMEGAPELVNCIGDDKSCVLAQNCRISPFLHQLNDDIQAILEKKTLADMQAAD